MKSAVALLFVVSVALPPSVAEARHKRSSSRRNGKPAAAAPSPPAPAAAVPPTDDEKKTEAQKLVKEARSLFDKKQFQPAVEKFEAAWKLFPVPKMLYNIAVTYEALHREDRAACAFERFLVDVPVADSGLREDAQQRFDKLAPTLGRVRVEAPAGVALFLDGEERATAPIPRAFCATPGKHRVVGLAIGSAPVGIGVEVRAGGEVKVDLNPASNQATVLALPSSSLVTPAATPAPAQKPLYKKWWVWTAVVGGMVIAGGVAAGIAVGTRPMDVSPPASDFGPFKVFTP